MDERRLTEKLTHTDSYIHDERQVIKDQVRLVRAGHTITEEEQEVTRQGSA